MGGVQALKMREELASPGRDQVNRWVDRAREGDQVAFEKLYRAHCGRIYALCWRLCGNDRALAEDLVQESFVRAWNKLHLFEGKSAFGTWLHRLAANVALSDRRIRLKRVTREEPLADDAEQKLAGQTDLVVDLNADLEAAIGQLPERARTVLVLYDIEGYQHNEIAEMTGMAEGSSKAQLHRARKLVREALEA
jgi:RNA polymerase sigma-70 factor (ECF subfamily)